MSDEAMARSMTAMPGAWMFAQPSEESSTDKPAQHRINRSQTDFIRLPRMRTSLDGIGTPRSLPHALDGEITSR